jgi:sulfur carrier protein ThiS
MELSENLLSAKGLNMKATVHLYGRLRRFSKSETPGLTRVDIPVGSTIEDLIDHIGIDRKEVMATAVNGKACAMNRQISENDEVHLIAHLGGG